MKVQGPNGPDRLRVKRRFLWPTVTTATVRDCIEIVTEKRSPVISEIVLRLNRDWSRSLEIAISSWRNRDRILVSSRSLYIRESIDYRIYIRRKDGIHRIYDLQSLRSRIDLSFVSGRSQSRVISIRSRHNLDTISEIIGDHFSVTIS